MTPEQLREAAAVMLAAADGKQIEFRARDNGIAWIALTNPEHRYDFRWYDYRTKGQ